MPDLETAPSRVAGSDRYEVPPGGAHPALKMLDLPPRGDGVARRWFIWGIVFYVSMTGVLVGTLVYSAAPGARRTALTSLVGLGQHPNPALSVLILAGIGLTVGAAWKVWADIREIRREEIDIDWVQLHKREGLLLVFADPAEREKMFQDGVRSIPRTGVAVETLTDDRVRRIHTVASTGGAAVATQELQSVAEARTARFGSFARYATSLLLLLAVLGTFAGVKTALPSLIDALGDKSLSTASLTVPLNAIAGAFGGNALALVGAIAVGLMAQGVGFARRNVLERLELVSAEYIYGHGVTADANPLQAAVNALRDTASQIHAATGMMAGIEGGLQALGSDFRSSFNSLADRLHDITARQEEGLYERTADALDTLQGRIADVAKLIESNALAHAGLVSSVQERAEESRQAIAQMKLANERLGIGLDAFVKVGEGAERSFEELQKASGLLAENSQAAGQQVEQITRGVEKIRPGLDAFASEISSATSELQKRSEESRAAWSALSEEVARKLRENTRPPGGTVAALAPAGFESNREAIALLQRIARSAEARETIRPRLATLFAAPLLGTLVGGGIMYLLLRLL